MHTVDQRRTTVAPSDQVVASLGQRPAPWLRPFLQLAAQPWHTGGASQWFRIGPFDADLRARLVWHPHGSDELFRSFRGTLAVERTPDGSVVILTGRAEGGTAPAAQQATESLVELLATAVAASGDRHHSG